MSILCQHGQSKWPDIQLNPLIYDVRRSNVMLFSACCFSAFSNHLLFVIMPSVTFNSNAENFNRMPLLWPGVMTYIIITKRMVKGPELFGEPFFLPFCFFWISSSVHFPCYLRHFGAGSCHFNGICKYLEFEPLIFHGICNISVLFAAFWSWKLPFQQYLQHFWVWTSHFPWYLQLFAACWCSNCSCNMVVCK